VFRVKRKQQHIEVSYRVVPGNPLSTSLQPNNTILGFKLESITSLEREYGALKGLQYYDLCDEIIRAKPSPLLTYKDSQIQPLISNYNVNPAQARAIKSAIDNDAFTLIQG
jgi:senataxin